MQSEQDIRVAVVSGRQSLDLAINTWVPGYVARSAPDVDTVVDLTRDGGVVLLDLAGLDRSLWLEELRSRGVDAPLVVVSDAESRDGLDIVGHVIDGPLRVEDLQAAFDAARSRTMPASGQSTTPHPTGEPVVADRDAKTSAPDGGPATSPPATPQSEPRSRRAGVGENGRGGFLKRIFSKGSAGAHGSRVVENVDAEAASAVPLEPSEPLFAREPTIRPAVPPTDGGDGARSRQDDVASGDDPDGYAQAPQDGAIIASDAASLGWLLLDELATVIQDGASVVALLGTDASYTPVAAAGIAPIEGAAAFPDRHPLFDELMARGGHLVVPSTITNRLGLENVPLAECSALLAVALPRAAQPAGLLLIGRLDDFTEEEVRTVTSAVADAPRLIQRLSSLRQHSVAELPRAGQVQVVTPAAVASWGLLHEIFPVLEEGAGLVSLRGTDASFATVAAIRTKPANGARSILAGHPLFERLAGSDGAFVVTSRAEDRSFTVDLPLGHHDTIAVVALGEAARPEGVLLLGRSRWVERHELAQLVTAVHDGEHGLASVLAGTGKLRGGGPHPAAGAAE
jgi:hypothetical protein